MPNLQDTSKTLVLASGSPFRRTLLEAAGVEFEVQPAHIDERAVELPIRESGAGPDEIARELALAKARNIAAGRPGDFVIGCDQVMSMDGRLFHKCASLAEARAQLAMMRGKTHRLSSGLAIVRNGDVLWSEVFAADMTFRAFSEDFLDSYVERAGTGVLLSVGAYQYEGLGQQLFEKVEGDYFTIIGLPMLPLLAALRRLGVIHG